MFSDSDNLRSSQHPLLKKQEIVSGKKLFQLNQAKADFL